MTPESEDPHFRARRVHVDDERLVIELRDGREIVAPTDTVPELVEASADERRSWRPLGGGRVIEWPRLNVRVAVKDLPPPTTTW